MSNNLRSISIKDGLPAINVKYYGRFQPTLIDAMSLAKQFEGYTAAYAKTLTQEEHDAVYQATVESWWDTAIVIAARIWMGYGKVEVVSAGRSSGWITLWGLPAPEEWDAETWAKWAEWESEIGGLLADVPYQYHWQIAANLYEPRQEALRAHQDELRRILGTATPTDAEAADALLGVR